MGAELFAQQQLPYEKQAFEFNGTPLKEYRNETRSWGANTLAKTGAEIPQNIMRAGKITKAIETAKTRFKKIYFADIGMPLDADLQIQPVINDARSRAADFVNDHPDYGRYTAAQGLPMFRKSVADFYSSFYGLTISPDWVVASNGASEMWERFVASQLEPGDMILTLDPHYNPFDVDLAMKGVDWLPIKTKAENGFHFAENDLSKALKEKAEKQPLGRIAAVYINSPANPTGVVYSEKELDTLVDFALRNDIFIVMDSVYSLYNYGSNPSLVSYLRDMPAKKRELVYKKLVFMDSMSKLATTTGTRVGMNIVPDNSLREHLNRSLGVRGNINNLAQIESAYILNSLSDDLETKMGQVNGDIRTAILYDQASLYYRKMEKFVRILNKKLSDAESGRKVNLPDGGLYITLPLGINALDFFTWSMTEYVADSVMTFVPEGVAFDDGSEASFRVRDFEKASQEIRICIGMDETEIETAAETFVKQLNAYRQSLSEMKAVETA
ncbi:MAG: pyridoxal phosphate-dependent aminotransferase [Patescibacteria group bacterium]